MERLRALIISATVDNEIKGETAVPNTAGRPRDNSIDSHILDATVTILSQKGYSGLTMDAVATAAKISKHTLYRRYKSPAALTVGLLQHLAHTTIKIPDTGSFEQDLTLMLQDVRQLFQETPFGAVIPALIGASTGNSELASQARSLLKMRRSLMTPVVERAIERGEISKSTQPSHLLEYALSPLYYRHIISGEQLSDQFIVATVKLVLSSYSRR